jgi:hypothetical protein
MAESVPGTPPSLRPPEDHLDSWKEIAAYLNRDVTTVQRWEKREGMPVHRHQHDRMGSAGWPSLPLALLHRGWPILRVFLRRVGNKLLAQWELALHSASARN